MLYRTGRFGVTLAAATALVSAWLLGQGPTPQYGHKAVTVKGPRAVGLVQIPSKGKARLIPIAIMMDGKFYDAGSYKATPVPMALDFGIVYEGFRSGVSQGVFTITQPGQLNHVWIAEGTWLPAGMRAPETSKKYSTPVIADDDKDGPPVLHRRAEKADSDGDGKEKSKDDKGKDKNSDKDKSKDEAKGATSAGSPSGPAGTSAPVPAPAPDTAKAPAAPEAGKAAASAPEAEENISDPNRPRLRRGKPDPSTRHEAFTTFDPLTDVGPVGASVSTGSPKSDVKAKDPASAAVTFTFVPAISDAGGPDPRPYTYEVKPAEEAIYRNKMLDLAGFLLRNQGGVAADAAPAGKKTSGNKSPGKSAKPPKAAFEDVKLRIFDLSNSNQPILVMSAKTGPPAGGGTGNLAVPKEVTLIARTDLEGELHKLFFSQTDSGHLDVTPRMELIDAVDADGDGRGELLFRRTFDSGSAYAIYRVTADQLWPLFEGTP